MTDFVCYCRVSTPAQGVSGLGLEAQSAAVRGMLKPGDAMIASFVEIESGKRSDRPELAKALAECKRRKATLAIAKLDRLARNVHFISGLMESGVDFVCADSPEADRTFLQMAAVFSEWEGRKISERTRDALAAAKARGVKLGNPVNLSEAAAKGREATQAQADQFAANVIPVIDAIKSSGITTLAGIASALNNRGVKTQRGGSWFPTTVVNVVKRGTA